MRTNYAVVFQELYTEETENIYPQKIFCCFGLENVVFIILKIFTAGKAHEILLF